MKVLLKRRLFLGGNVYEPDAAGTELPDTIGGRKVVLYDPKNPPKPRRNPAVLFEVSPDQSTMTRVKDDELVAESDTHKDVIVLPADCVAWTDKASKEFAPEGPQLMKGSRQIETPLSSLTPGPAKTTPEGTATKKAGEEK